MDNRAQLLAVALKLFVEHGYDAVGVQAIVEAAGVTKPTLYHYFGSKRGLFEALVHEQAEPLLAEVSAASAYRGDITQSILRVVRAYFGFAGEQPAFYRLLLSMWFSPPSSEYFPAVQQTLGRQTEMLEGLFCQAARDHGNMRDRHQLYAVSLKGLIDTYIALGLLGYVDLASDALQYRIIHQFMHGIFS